MIKTALISPRVENKSQLRQSIPQIVFQAIVASFYPQKTAFLRPKMREAMAKIYTALNKENGLK